MSSNRVYAALWIGAAAVVIALGAANLWYGDLNQDEGWYLYTASLVARGERPYLDFAFTQGPVMPMVYALAHPLVDRWGVAGGRLFTMILGLAAAVCAAFFAARVAGPTRARHTALLAFILIALNVHQSYFTTIVKTYALSALFISAGFLFLTARGKRHARGMACAAAVLFVLAAGVRISAAAIVPAVALFLWVVRAERPGQWLWFAGGAGLAALAIFMPFYLMAPDGFIFGMFKYHTLRGAEGGFKTWLVYRAAFTSRLVQAYFVAFGVLATTLVARWCHRRESAGDGMPAPDRLVWAAWVSVIGITMVHALAPMPYDDYQVMLYPLFAALLAVGVVQTIREERFAVPVICLVALLATAAAFSSPINQDWFTRGRDRIWWRLKEKTALQVLRESARKIRAVGGDCRDVLTQDTYLAVEARLRVPRGLELGPFSYYPGLTTAAARKLRVVNTPLLTGIIRNSKCRVTAISGYSFSIASPEVRPLTVAEKLVLNKALTETYIPFDHIPDFGQGNTPLLLGRLR